MEQSSALQKTIGIIIPCFNEAEILEQTLHELKTSLTLFPSTTILVCDDGSSDVSVAIARACDVEVLTLTHQGLGATIRAGFEVCKARNFDYVVTFDADGQYHPNSISALLEPLLQSQADVSLGQRNPKHLGHRTPIRQFFHWASTVAIRQATGLNLLDAGTGFRAYNQIALQKLEIQSNYDHTAETLIQLKYHQLRVAPIPIQSRVTPRASKLVTNHLFHAIREVSLFLKAIWRYRKHR